MSNFAGHAKEPTERKTIQSINRAIAILHCFHDKRELTLTEISQAMGLHKSTTSGIVNTLKSEKFLEQDKASGKYKLGLEIFRLAINSRMELNELCEPYLDELMRLTGETVNLGVSDGAEVVYVLKKESAHSLQMSIKVGTRRPIYCTALGKAMLSAMDESRAEKLIHSLKLTAYTKNTLTDVDALLREIEMTREHGVAYDMEELESGLICIAMPLYYKKGHPLGALSVSGPALRMDDQRRDHITTQLREVCKVVNNELCRVGIV
jgi:DNA-binding IclR family transcriptional regulator